MPPLTPTQVQIIKSTVPVLAEHGEAITTKFYADMLAAHAALKHIFNTTHQATGHQPRALARALYAYAAHIDDLDALSPALELICHKHVSLFIQPEHYDIVGTHLLGTMATVLGDAVATPEILDAWDAAYVQLANIMIGKEDGLYKATTPGWEGWRDFRIARKVRESEEIVSLYLTPVVGEGVDDVPMYKPGQYVSVNVCVGEVEGGMWQARQYSLSDAPGKGYLRISVKREKGVEVGEPKHVVHEGCVSNVLHEKKDGDVVKISHPFGDFFFEDSEEKNKDGPVVLISAGVGLTCLTSILNSLMEKESERPVTWIHGARNARVRAFKKDVDALATNHANLKKVYFCSNPMEGEVEDRDYDIKGRVDLDKVGRKDLFTDNDNTQYYVCGPTQFMLDIEARLKSYGVKKDKVKMELFGTGGVPRI